VLEFFFNPLFPVISLFSPGESSSFWIETMGIRSSSPHCFAITIQTQP
jgi:hypothetical protein